MKTFSEKKILLFLFISVLVSVLPVHATVADFYFTKLEPDTMVSGEAYDLNITLKNLGTSYATFLKSELDPSDISPIDTIGSLKRYVGTVRGAEPSGEYFSVVKQRDEVKIHYSVRVDENAAEGTYQVPLVLKWEGDVGSRQETLFFGVDIKTSEPSMEVEKNLPEFVQPGEEFEIILKIRNTGAKLIKDISISTKPDAPFSVRSGSNRYVSNMRPGEEKEVSFRFVTDKEADVGLYSLQFPLEYRDKSDAVFKKTETAGIIMKGKARLDIADLKIEPQNPKKGETITIELRIENVGDDDAVNTKLTLESKLEGFKTAYIGELKKDDDTPAIFTLKSTEAGDIVNKLTLTYEDDFGEHARSEEIRFNISDDQTQNVGKILIILLVAGVFVVYFTAKKRKG